MTQKQATTVTRPKGLLLIDEQAWMKLKYYVQSTPGEISGLGKAEIDPETGVITAVDFRIFEQVSSAAHTQISDEAQAKFMLELMQSGEDMVNWCIWWHSHGELSSFFSHTDVTTINSHQNQDFLISLVTNRRAESEARLDIWATDNSPFKIRTQYTRDLDVVIAESEDLELKAEIEAEVKTKLKAPLPVVVKKGYTPRSQTNQQSMGFKADDKDDGKEKTDDDSFQDSDFLDDDVDANMASLIAGSMGRNFNRFGYDEDGYDIYGYSYDGTYDADRNLMS